MQISYADLLLCSDSLAVGRVGPAELRIAGRQVNDTIDLARAVAASVISRGNRTTPVSFTVSWFFSTRRLAGLFAATHFASLPESGDLVLTVGDSGDQSVCTLADACLVACEPVQRGVCVQVAYQFDGGLFTSADALADALDLALISTSNGAQVVNSGASAWLQLLDQGTLSWVTLWLSHGALAVGHTLPLNTTAVRSQVGFLQLRDAVDDCWRSIWFNGAALVVGPADVTADAPAALLADAAYRLKATAAGYLLQLLDQADGAKFRTLIITNGAAGAGPLEA